MIGKISYMAIPATPKLAHGIDGFIFNACKAGGITYSDLMSKSRKNNICNVRHIVAYNLITRFLLTHEKAGKMLDIDHSSFPYARKKYTNLYSVDFDFKNLADKINSL